MKYALIAVKLLTACFLLLAFGYSAFASQAIPSTPITAVPALYFHSAHVKTTPDEIFIKISAYNPTTKTVSASYTLTVELNGVVVIREHRTIYFGNGDRVVYEKQKGIGAGSVLFILCYSIDNAGDICLKNSPPVGTGLGATGIAIIYNRNECGAILVFPADPDTYIYKNGLLFWHGILLPLQRASFSTKNTNTVAVGATTDVGTPLSLTLSIPNAADCVIAISPPIVTPTIAPPTVTPTVATPTEVAPTVTPTVATPTSTPTDVPSDGTAIPSTPVSTPTSVLTLEPTETTTSTPVSTPDPTKPAMPTVVSPPVPVCSSWNDINENSIVDSDECPTSLPTEIEPLFMTYSFLPIVEK